MKKIYSYAMAAAVVCMMASCGSKGGEKAADTQETEAPAEEMEVTASYDDDVLTEATTFDAESFSITAPAGWWVSEHSETMVDMMLPCETGDCKSVNTMASNSLSIDESIEMATYDGFVELEPVTINGIEYRVSKKDDSHPIIYRTPLANGGNLGIYVSNSDINDEVVKGILESIVLK